MAKYGPISTKALMARSAEHARTGGSEPKAPAKLSAKARKEWERVTDELRLRKSLDSLDEVALTDYLTCWIRLGEAEREIENRGILVPGERGLVKNPAVQVARMYRDAMVTWSKELGFTLNSRSRLTLPAPEPPKVNRFALLGEARRPDITNGGGYGTGYENAEGDED